MQTLKVFEGNLVGLQSNMLNYALALTANKETAEDLRQETNLRTLDNWDKFKDNRNFKGWVLTIMRNLFVNDYHKDTLRRSILSQTNNYYYLNLFQNLGAETPETVYGYIEITSIINSFEDKDKTPFWMYISGYKYKEIAKIMKLPLGTVKSRIFLVRKMIQKKLNDTI